MYYRIFITLILALVSINNVSANSSYNRNRNIHNKHVRELRNQSKRSPEEIIQKSLQHYKIEQLLRDMETRQQQWSALVEYRKNHPLRPSTSIVSGVFGNKKVGHVPRFKVTSDTYMLRRSWSDFEPSKELVEVLGFEPSVQFQLLLWDLKHPTMPGVSPTEPTSDYE